MLKETCRIDVINKILRKNQRKKCTKMVMIFGWWFLFLFLNCSLIWKYSPMKMHKTFILKNDFHKSRLNYGSDLAQAVGLRQEASSTELLMTALEENISNLLVLVLIGSFHFHYHLLMQDNVHFGMAFTNWKHRLAAILNTLYSVCGR